MSDAFVSTDTLEFTDPDDFVVNYDEALLEEALELHSVRDLIRFTVSALRGNDVFVGHGGTDHFAEAAALVLHTLNLAWSADPEILDARLTVSEKRAVLALLEARIRTRKPLSYLVNLSYFCELPFYVDERVLIPRSPIGEMIRQKFYPWFELSADAVPQNGTDPLDFDHYFAHGLDPENLPEPERILDLCTGSGCIALALAKFFPDAMVDAVDISDDALEVAAINVEHHGRVHQVNLVKSNLFDKLDPAQPYELIVTNPPYVDAEDMSELPPEIEHEPELALAAGHDGLDLVHGILAHSAEFLTPNGLLICEVGNSEWALRQAYPHIEFNWLVFKGGGSGIFAITKSELETHHNAFCEKALAVTPSTLAGA